MLLWCMDGIILYQLTSWNPFVVGARITKYDSKVSINIITIGKLSLQSPSSRSYFIIVHPPYHQVDRYL